ncbi:hypothetical protein E4U43_004905 [Claviceps pusilla]|uniref:Uncharacterized protein n=1 Tax=Claviceps pusilla TaxID=123648 RepID=A0A9P7T075_9HYPO|nr:hypothetical protein E4U43_004905 [Claviceps pusilla]
MGQPRPNRFKPFHGPSWVRLNVDANTASSVPGTRKLNNMLRDIERNVITIRDTLADEHDNLPALELSSMLSQPQTTAEMPRRGSSVSLIDA